MKGFLIFLIVSVVILAAIPCVCYFIKMRVKLLPLGGGVVTEREIISRVRNLKGDR